MARREHSHREVRHEMSHHTGQKRASPCTDEGENQAEQSGGDDAAAPLVEMRQSKKQRGNEDSGNDGTGGHVLKGPLDEAAINPLLANGDGKDDGEKGESLCRGARKNLCGDAVQRRARTARMAGHLAKSDDLVDQQGDGEDRADGEGKGGSWQGCAERGERRVVRADAPIDYSGGEPLKCHGGSVELEAIERGKIGVLEQAKNPVPAQPGNGDGKEKND